jgi:hypothetical protein
VASAREAKRSGPTPWISTSIVPIVSTRKPQKIVACIAPAPGSRSIFVCATPTVSTFLSRCQG